VPHDEERRAPRDGRLLQGVGRRRFELLWSHELPPEAATEPDAEWLLGVLDRSAANRRVMRRFASGAGGTFAATDHEIGAHMRRLARLGKVKLLAREHVEPGAPYWVHEEVPPPPPSLTRVSWIEFEVHDWDGRPVAGVAYRMDVSDGRSLRGETNGAGLLRVDEIPPGVCSIALVDFDEDAWEGVDCAPPPAKEAPPPAPAKTKAKEWIETQVQDLHGDPVSGVLCFVKQRGLVVATARTNAQGVLRVEGVDPVDCEICLPEVDADAWERAD
jgi:hypothetical protein